MSYIEFIKGIPHQLSEETFLDTDERNIIVFDDLMPKPNVTNVLPTNLPKALTTETCLSSISLKIYFPREKLAET